MEREEKFTVTVQETEYEVTVVPVDEPDKQELNFRVLIEGREVLIYPADGFWATHDVADPSLVQNIGEAIEDYYE